MAHIERSIDISASRPTVWDVVADLENVASWNPSVSSAVCGYPSVGLGASRTCLLTKGGRIDEVVSEWDEGASVQFSMGIHGGIRSADMGIRVSPSATGTRVTAVADYHLSFGPLGPVVDRFAVKRQMTRMLDDTLEGLKNHVQDNGEQAPRKELS